jgi:hypothetical protein
MAGKEYTIDELLALINKELAADPPLDQAQMMEKLYEGRGVTGNQRVTGPQLSALFNAIKNNNEIGDVFANIISSSRNEALVALINSHNPYTSDAIGDMTIFSGNPDPEEKGDNKISQVELEVDGPYSMAMEWNFKGSSQKINKTIRIKYRYRARNLHNPERPKINPPHWVTAYLLIGYEDGGE